MPLHKLLNLAGPANGPTVSVAQGLDEGLSDWGTRGREVAELLSCRNGFYAFESSLLVRGITKDTPPQSISAWNSKDGWIAHYSAIDLEPMLCFAEDVFGHQFAIVSEKIVLFDPETGSTEHIADTLEGWASLVMNDYAYHTGLPIAHEWQSENGPLQAGMKLMPTIPFVCGGDFAIDNMKPIDELQGMTFRADLASQIKDLPDGANITFNIVE